MKTQPPQTRLVPADNNHILDPRKPPNADLLASCSATEILYALDLSDSVAGVTFECDLSPGSPAEAGWNTSLGHDLLQPKLIVTSRIKPELIVSSSCANWE